MEKVRKKCKVMLGEKDYQSFILMFLVCVACCRYFYKILSYPCYYYDEVNELSIVTGFMNTKTFYCWDFINNCISDVSYTRAWTYTVLLALWLKIFGNSLLSARMLSVIIGVLFIASVIYIVKKEINKRVAIYTSILLIANNDVTYVFRFVRMYCLGMLLCIWAAYFFYRAIFTYNNLKRNNKITNFINNYLDFNIKYAFIGLIIFYFAFVTHINTIIIAGGIVCYVICLAISEREKKYIITSCLVVGLSILMLVGIVVPAIYNNIGILYSIRDHLMNMTKLSAVANDITMLFMDVKMEYLYFFLDVIGNRIVISMFLISSILRLLIKEKKENSFMIYCLLISFVGILFFMFVSSRYFKGRYAIFLMPFFLIVIASGIDFFFEIIQCKFKYALLVPILVLLCYNVKDGNWIYTQADCGNFVPAYQKMLESCDKDKEFAVMGVQFMANYFSEISEGYNCKMYNLEDFDYERFMNVAREYPEGMIAIDLNKFKNIADDKKQMIWNWTDRIAGSGMDDYNVEISRYHLIEESEQPNGEELRYNNNFSNFDIAINGNSLNVKIKITDENLLNNASLVCIGVVCQDSEENVEKKFLQLDLSNLENGYFDIVLQNEDNVQGIALEEVYAYFDKEGNFIY